MNTKRKRSGNEGGGGSDNLEGSPGHPHENSGKGKRVEAELHPCGDNASHSSEDIGGEA